MPCVYTQGKRVEPEQAGTAQPARCEASRPGGPRAGLRHERSTLGTVLDAACNVQRRTHRVSAVVR